ncbi:hypothetical protein DICVIV_05015 [Dictyocaulus viviparus]|uniref:Vacuolar protein sorting-associated protein 13 VPS13 adaptor binding domain-containing protein n=1 Tax=Dictyocaulus viviparus TaxID=29172 RepID=A0A0D8XWF1_DICVI|nr:hypothetical protein DICVIV_05015 [Dictyocaulus viviparus]
MELTFEFPPRLLLYTNMERESPRQLIIRVNGWDEISPVNVDSCGTYFRLVKAVKKGIPMTRVVVQVTVEKDGKKVVTVRSSIDVRNMLPHQLCIYTTEAMTEVMIVEPSQTKSIPLPFVHSRFLVCPLNCKVQEKAEVIWSNVRAVGKKYCSVEKLRTSDKMRNYWLCTSVRREHYPDHETIPGHTVFVAAPLNIQNLLPIDVEIHILGQAFPISAGRTLMITTVDITKPFAVGVATERMKTIQECIVSKSHIGEGQLVSLRLD